MSYTNPITCENASLTFQDILSKLYTNDGYIRTYGDIGSSCDVFEDGSDEWRICCGEDGEFEIEYKLGTWELVWEGEP